MATNNPQPSTSSDTASSTGYLTVDQTFQAQTKLEGALDRSITSITRGIIRTVVFSDRSYDNPNDARLRRFKSPLIRVHAACAVAGAFDANVARFVQKVNGDRTLQNFGRTPDPAEFEYKTPEDQIRDTPMQPSLRVEAMVMTRITRRFLRDNHGPCGEAQDAVEPQPRCLALEGVPIVTLYPYSVLRVKKPGSLHLEFNFWGVKDSGDCRRRPLWNGKQINGWQQFHQFEDDYKEMAGDRNEEMWFQTGIKKEFGDSDDSDEENDSKKDISNVKTESNDSKQ